MADSSEQSILARITTKWSQVTNPVHFVARYAKAVHNYLNALIRDPHDAADAAQDFLAKVSEKGFERLTLDRGRFRDYLIVAVRNTALNAIKKKGRQRSQQASLGDPAIEEELTANSDAEWVAQWQRCILDRAFRDLFVHQRQSPDNLFHSILRARTDHPDVDDASLAERISQETGKPLRPEAFRKQLSRARRKFAECIVKEVAETLENPTPQNVEEELIDVGLMEYVRPFLPPNWRERGVM